MVEPGAPEHELAQPVDERLSADERQAFPVPDEVEPEAAPRIDDAPVGNELDEIRGLVVVEVVRADQAEPHAGGGDPFLEVLCAELEPVAEETRRRSRRPSGSWQPASRSGYLGLVTYDRRLWAVMAIVVLVVWLGGAAVTKYSLEQMAFVTPIAVVVVGVTVGLVLLWVKVVADSIRRRGRS